MSSIYAGGEAAITVTDSGGRLHGIWHSDFDVATSDRRLKKNIMPLSMEFASRPESRGKVIDQLRPVSFEMIDDSQERTRYGFIAQELEKVMPSLVVTSDGDSDGVGTKAVMYQDLIAILTMALQEQQDEIEQLRDAASASDELVHNLTAAARDRSENITALSAMLAKGEAERNSQGARLKELEKLVSKLYRRFLVDQAENVQAG